MLVAFVFYLTEMGIGYTCESYWVWFTYTVLLIFCLLVLGFSSTIWNIFSSTPSRLQTTYLSVANTNKKFQRSCINEYICKGIALSKSFLLQQCFPFHMPQLYVKLTLTYKCILVRQKRNSTWENKMEQSQALVLLLNCHALL